MSFFFKRQLNDIFLFFKRCYSVGALLWEIAELTKPHSDLSSELLINIRKRVKDNYVPPFSVDVPNEWKHVVSRGMYKIECYDEFKVFIKSLKIFLNIFFFVSSNGI